MEIYINDFTKLKFKMIDEKISSKIFNLEINNKYFSYRNEIEIEAVRLDNLILQIGRFLKGKLCTNNIIKANEEKLNFFVTPDEIQMEISLRNNEGKEISNYFLNFEREDIISLYLYLCKIMKKENILNLNENYKYMYLYVRYLDTDTTRQFCYISDDEDIRIGDYVLVNRKEEYVIAIVEKIEFYTKEEAPYSIEKTKEIIRKIEKSELKNLEDSAQEKDGEKDSYITIEEFKEIKQDLDTIKKIITNQKHNISLKELMKQINRDNIYLKVYYYPKMNFFIGNVSEIYFLVDYKRKIFSSIQYKEMIKNAINIPAIVDADIMDIYNKAIKICEENNLEYDLDVNVEHNIIPDNICKVNSIFYEKEDKSADFLYKNICEKIYSNLKMYVKDIDLDYSKISLYQNNIGKIIKEKEYLKCTSRIGGQTKNTRFFIIGNEIRDYSIFEENTNWGICIANKENNFKIIDVNQINNKNYIILLQIPNKTVLFMKNINTNVDENIKRFCEEE